MPVWTPFLSKLLTNSGKSYINQQDKCPDIYSKTCPDNNPMEKQKIQKYTKMSEYVETLVLFRTFCVQFSSKKLSAYMMINNSSSLFLTV